MTVDPSAGSQSLRKAARSAGVPVEAMAFQGERAGLVSRVIANAIDFALIVTLMVSCFLGWAALLFLWSPTSFTFPSPPLGIAVLVGGVLLGTYFWVFWVVNGRTYGDHVMGLRVVNYNGLRMRWVGGLLRAAFCVVFPIGLFWVLVSGANRSIQDVVLRTSVIYDWGHTRPPAEPGILPTP